MANAGSYEHRLNGGIGVREDAERNVVIVDGFDFEALPATVEQMQLAEAADMVGEDLDRGEERP